MTEEKGIVVSGGSGYMPIADVQVARVRYQAMKEFVSGILKVGVDFGAIPGTDKPTLLKPGAEKLATFFGLAPVFEIVEKELDWTGREHDGEPFFYFHYRCRMMRGDRLAAEGEGSSNSFEKKYRYRSANRKCPKCGQETIIKGKQEYGGGWICFAKKGGCGAKFKDGDQSIEGQETGQVKNPDISDIVNTLQKMAQKRAYVAAVLLAVNGSEYFTQDIEDFIEGTYVIEPAKNWTPAPDPQPVDEIPVIERKPAARPIPELIAPNGEAAQDLIDDEIRAESNGDRPRATPQKMSRSTAEAILNDDGIRYGDLPNDKLSNMTIGIGKALRKSDLTPEERAEYRMKLDAIGVILKARATS